MRNPQYIILFILLVLTTTAYGQSDRVVWLEGEFWSELEPAVQDSDEYPLSKEEAARRMLEEALFVFSGMIYGFRFTYVPSDAVRQVKEEFVLVPLYRLSWGDAGLTVRQSRKNGDILVGRIRYTLEEFQSDRIEGWKSNIFPIAAGRGSATIFNGYTNKVSAIEDGVKGAVREYARTRVLNKPRKVSGETLLTSVPRIIIEDGSYHAFVEIKLRKVDIQPYSGY